jgi:DNA modification methylase
VTAVILRGDAAQLLLPDACADLIVTSPPYFALRSYSDNGEHYEGQIGSEETPTDYVSSLLDCTREWMRVLKPEGSIFVNLGDKYSNGSRNYYAPGTKHLGETVGKVRRPEDGFPPKTLLGLPWCYALACIDDLGLILRAEIIWEKPNGLPESVKDRVRRSHEQVFHFVKQPRYFTAVDEIREDAVTADRKGSRTSYPPGSASGSVDANGKHHHREGSAGLPLHPLGKLPGSVWDIPSAPLKVPDWVGVDHFAAYPPELCRRIILGWSPKEICIACGEGRKPVTKTEYIPQGDHNPKMGREKYGRIEQGHGDVLMGRFKPQEMPHGRANAQATIIGYSCACTPYTDHPGDPSSRAYHGSSSRRNADVIAGGKYESDLGGQPRTGRWREYYLDGWDAPPTRPGVVLDPFGGTGTTAMTASVLGRIGISVDRSADYCRLARWRVNDPAQRAKVLRQPAPKRVPDDQPALFDW